MGAQVAAGWCERSEGGRFPYGAAIAAFMADLTPRERTMVRTMYRMERAVAQRFVCRAHAFCVLIKARLQ